MEGWRQGFKSVQVLCSVGLSVPLVWTVTADEQELILFKPRLEITLTFSQLQFFCVLTFQHSHQRCIHYSSSVSLTNALLAHWL